MIRLYSRRLLSPFVGLVLIAEADRARALSTDGVHWAIQYAMTDAARQRPRAADADHRLHYAPVATIEHGELKPRALHPFLNLADVRAAAQDLCEAVTAVPVPFAAADRYEYWLLDGADGSPLALLESRIDAPELASTPSRPAWIAMPAAQLDVPAPEHEMRPTAQTAQRSYLPPVNYRLQKLVEERAGPRPRAAWFDRRDPATAALPPCLIREDWADAHQHQLCERYIRRLAPRLLMLQSLPDGVRRRLEEAARDYVFDVERFFPLYPAVIDDTLLTAARVEARLRHAAGGRD